MRLRHTLGMRTGCAFSLWSRGSTSRAPALDPSGSSPYRASKGEPRSRCHSIRDGEWFPAVIFGRPDGSRTRVTSVENSRSAVELQAERKWWRRWESHPRLGPVVRGFYARRRCFVLGLGANTAILASAIFRIGSRFPSPGRLGKPSTIIYVPTSHPSASVHGTSRSCRDELSALGS